jgi:hypothetical protein
MRHYYILNQDPRAEQVFEFIRDHRLAVSVHLNRTRFWVPTGTVLTEFLLRFGECARLVDPTLDLATGLPLDYLDGQ